MVADTESRGPALRGLPVCGSLQAAVLSQRAAVARKCIHPSTQSQLMLGLVYVSHAVAPVDTGPLLKQAWEKNPGTGITGGLAVLDDVFFQYLEGEDEQVDALFARISNDHRHKDVKVLERRAVARRMFADWSMAMLVWTDETRNIFRSFSPDSVLDLYQTDPSTAAPLFRAWAATSAWTTGS